MAQQPLLEMMREMAVAVVSREEERVSREALLYFSLFFGTLVLLYSSFIYIAVQIFGYIIVFYG